MPGRLTQGDHAPRTEHTRSGGAQFQAAGSEGGSHGAAAFRGSQPVSQRSKPGRARGLLAYSRSPKRRVERRVA